MKVLYAIDFDETRTPCLEYHYELPESLDGKIELKEAEAEQLKSTRCRWFINTDKGIIVDGYDDTDWYYEHIAKATREEVAEFDRKVWEAMRVAGIRK